jgi:hypothetical protein
MTSIDDYEDLHASILVTLSLTAKQDDGPGRAKIAWRCVCDPDANPFIRCHGCTLDPPHVNGLSHWGSR